MASIFSRFRERFSARQRAVLCILGVLLMCCVSAAVAKVMNKNSPILLGVPKADAFENTQLIALDSGAKNRILDGRGTYKFTQKQILGIQSFLSQYMDGALTLVVKRDGPATGSFDFGFLHDGDVTGKDETSTPVASCDMAQFARYRLTLSFGKDKEGNVVIPSGFFADSQCPVQIEEALITRAAIGYDKRGSTPHFAFSATGGKADMTRSSVDFSGGSALFPTQNGLLEGRSSAANGSMVSIRSATQPPTPAYGGAPTNHGVAVVMPKIIVKLEETADENAKCSLNFGGQTFTLWRYKGETAKSDQNTDTLTIYAAALKMPFNMAKVEDAVPAALMMVASDEELSPVNGKVLVPYKTDPGFIIPWPQSSWRTDDYELFEWDRFPKVLFMDFRNYEVQSAFLRRLAFFTEKKGFRGRLASDEELKGKHDYNAHDYRAESLAAFYSKAKNEDFALNESEMLLRDILLQNEVIKSSEDGYAPSGGALISISKESEMWLRDRLLSHEGWHGVYFTNERFRNAVAAVYGTMDEVSRDFLEQYWGTQEGLGYDTTDAYLTQNEFMAYLMQQRLSEVAQYFVHLANRGSVMRGIPELCQYVRGNGGQPFEDAARVLDEYAADNFGLAAGRISLVRGGQ